MENTSQTRSTVSFHLSTSEKERLVQAAQDSFGSITDYIKFKLFYNEDRKDLIQAQSRIDELQEKLNSAQSSGFLDDPAFDKIYQKVKGQELSVKSENGISEKLRIDSKRTLSLLMTKCFEVWS